jgi:hypothetical protein
MLRQYCDSVDRGPTRATAAEHSPRLPGVSGPWFGRFGRGLAITAVSPKQGRLAAGDSGGSPLGVAGAVSSERAGDGFAENM